MSDRTQSSPYKSHVKQQYGKNNYQGHSEGGKINGLRGTVLKRGFPQSDYLNVESIKAKHYEFGLGALPVFKKTSLIPQSRWRSDTIRRYHVNCNSI